MSESLSTAERHSILDGLESTDEEVRRLSVEQLVLLPMDEAADRLVACLGDSGWRVRKAAVGRLVAWSGDQRVQERLVVSLSDGENSGRRNAALEALIACGRRATGRLVREIENRDVDVRKLVIDALAAIGDPASRDALLRTIEDEDPNVRAAAAEALGVVGGVEEIPHLLALGARSGDEELVRVSALRALARMEANVGVASLGDSLDQSLLRPSAYELLGYSSDPQSVDELLKGLAIGGRTSREGAMGALLRTLFRLDGSAGDALVGRLRAAASSEQIVEFGCEQLDGADLGRRMVLIQFLGLLSDRRAVLPILQVGRDEAIEELADRTLEALGPVLSEALVADWSSLDVDLKTRATAILGRVGGANSEALIVEALGDSDAELRCVAAMALGEGGFFERAPDLVRRLEVAARDEDSDEEISSIIGAIAALSEHPGAIESGIDVQLIEVLSSRLGGASEPLRLAIAKVIARVGRPQDEDVIGYLLKDESAPVRRAAVQALGRFGDGAARDSLRLALGDEASMVRMAAAAELGDPDRPGAVVDLAGPIADEDPRVVSVALRSVGRLYRGQGLVFEEIAGLIEPSLEREALVALAGLDALMEVGGERAGGLAVRVLAHPEPDVVRAGVACLGAHGADSLIGELVPLVAHEDWSVRAETVQVMSDRAYRKGLPSLMRRLEVEEDAFVREAILRAIRRLEE